jgi:hypothetical protein
MEGKWFILSPHPHRHLAALEGACDRAVDAYLEENPDCEDTFGEVSAINAVPTEEELKRALGKKKGAAAVLARFEGCRASLGIERPGSLDDDPLQVSILGFLLEHAGEAIVLLDDHVPQLAETVLALLASKKGAEGFAEDITDLEVFAPPAAPAEPRAGRILSTFEAAQQNLDLAIDLRDELSRAGDLARRYAMLLMQEGALDDDRAARALKVHPSDLDDAADEVLRLTQRIRPSDLGADAVTTPSSDPMYD